MSRQVILRILGVLWIAFACMLSVYALTDFLTTYSNFTVLKSRLILSISVLGCGGGCYLVGRKAILKELSSRSAIILVILVWISMIFIGTIPYLWENITFVDALFESASGFSTTGATILENLETLPPTLLFWRSFTQWIGGMGIIVLFIAIFPSLGASGKRLFSNEMPGPIKESLTPHLKDTTQRLWIIYLCLTTILFIILCILGLSPFDAINHAFTTLATGGFSTKSNSLAAFSPIVQWVIAFFMLLGGLNFSLYILLLAKKMNTIRRDVEVRWYLYFIGGLSLFVTGVLYYTTEYSLPQASRFAFFTVISLTTTTGYTNIQYELFVPLVQALLMITFFTGGSAGSTSGGIKFYRIVLFFKAISIEVKKSISPHIVSSLNIGTFIVPEPLVTKIFVFLSVYFSSIGFISLLLVAAGIDFLTAFSAAATSIGNVGPAFGSIGSSGLFAHFSAFSKIICAFAMVLGRLEFFTFLAILQPIFWKR
ncbi:Trk system potassium uptake protein TrkH [Spirochaetota bacterium]|nr:Trk system potassium uptake protein TrkH [Spirochaetota bacterium]